MIRLTQPPARKPNGLRALVLFCSAGGDAMGWHMAGFDVTGVDNRPQRNFPFTFHQDDALTFPADGYDVVVASPPCQRYAKVTRWRGRATDHPDLVAPTRELLQASGLPWVMENVPEAPLRRDYVLCGSQFGLAVRRHRIMETSWGPGLVPPCDHNRPIIPFGHKNERAFADAMGCTWMTNREARLALPPAYGRFMAHEYLERHR